MTSFYNYNPEKKNSSFIDLYIMAFFIAFVLVFILIASGHGIKFLIAFAIKYYLWVLGVLAAIAIIVHFVKKRRADKCEFH